MDQTGKEHGKKSNQTHCTFCTRTNTFDIKIKDNLNIEDLLIPPPHNYLLWLFFVFSCRYAFEWHPRRKSWKVFSTCVYLRITDLHFLFFFSPIIMQRSIFALLIRLNTLPLDVSCECQLNRQILTSVFSDARQVHSRTFTVWIQ